MVELGAPAVDMGLQGGGLEPAVIGRIGILLAGFLSGVFILQRHLENQMIISLNTPASKKAINGVAGKQHRKLNRAHQVS